MDRFSGNGLSGVKGYPVGNSLQWEEGLLRAGAEEAWPFGLLPICQLLIRLRFQDARLPDLPRWAQVAWASGRRRFLYTGDSYENDIDPSRGLGMKAMHIEGA